VSDIQTLRFDFDKISNYDVEFSVSRPVLEERKIRCRKDRGGMEKWREDESKKVEYEGEYVRSLHYFCGHTWIHLNSCSLFRLFENLHGADFQHFVCRFQICLNRAITIRNSELLGHSFQKNKPRQLS